MMIGSRLGNYVIEEELGSGGMAIVYRARHVHLDRPAAIKVLAPNLAHNPRTRERFKQEALVMTRLRHPNIVEVYDYIETGVSAMAMELISGRTLAETLAAHPSPMNVPEAVSLMIPVLDAIGYAHAQGVLHRDLKPSNIMLSTQGDRITPLVLDFGLAKVLSDGAQRTRTGTRMGTMYYMAPEQHKGHKNIGPAADIYALGITLYELLTKYVPFTGESDYEVMKAHLELLPTAPSRFNPAISPAVEAVVLRAIQKESRDRWCDAAEFASALEAACEGRPVYFAPSPSPPSAPLPGYPGPALSSPSGERAAVPQQVMSTRGSYPGMPAMNSQPVPTALQQTMSASGSHPALPAAATQPPGVSPQATLEMEAAQGGSTFRPYGDNVLYAASSGNSWPQAPPAESWHGHGSSPSSAASEMAPSARKPTYLNKIFFLAGGVVLVAGLAVMLALALSGGKKKSTKPPPPAGCLGDQIEVEGTCRCPLDGQMYKPEAKRCVCGGGQQKIRNKNGEDVCGCVPPRVRQGARCICREPLVPDSKTGGCTCPVAGQMFSNGRCACTMGRVVREVNGAKQCACPPKQKWNGTDCGCPPGLYKANGRCKCPYRLVWRDGQCQCPAKGQTYNARKRRCECPAGLVVKDLGVKECGCPGNQQRTASGCACPDGKIWKARYKLCDCPKYAKVNAQTKRCECPENSTLSVGGEACKCGKGYTMNKYSKKCVRPVRTKPMELDDGLF